MRDLHVLEGVSDPADGDDVGELSMARLLPAVDPGHAGPRTFPPRARPGRSLADGRQHQPQCFQAQIGSILVFFFSLLLLSDLVFIDYT